MKKIFALIISLMLVTCLLAACGDDDTYRQPGTGTTLGGGTGTAPVVDDNNGSYSADPDGDVNQTTDNNILEDGINDIENGIEQGMDDLEQGMDDLENGAEDMLDGDGRRGDNADMNGINDDAANGDFGTNGMEAEGGSRSGAGNNAGNNNAGNNNNNNNNAGNTNGSTNGNSR